MPPEISLNERIRAIRIAKNLKQGQFARLLGYSQGRISEIETGSVSVSDRHIALICAKTGARIEWLRDGSGEMFDPAPGPSNSQISEPLELHSGDPVYAEAKQMLQRIFASKKDHIIGAIHSNLKVFCERIDHENEMAEMRQVFSEFKKRHAYNGEDRRDGIERRVVEGVSPTGIERRSGKDRRQAGKDNGNHI